MKKLLSLLLLCVAGTLFSMESDDRFRASLHTNPLVINSSFNKVEITDSRKPIAIDGYFNTVTVVNSDEPRKSWMPYIKIGAGLGLTGLSAWLCLKGDTLLADNKLQEQIPVNYNANHSTTAFLSPNISLGSTLPSFPGTRFLSPQIALSRGSLAALITAGPGYLLIKSGLKDLRLEKKVLLQRLKNQQELLTNN